eukprot:SAG11_NODE_1675_length_4475_cov_20.017824_3_plen_182_part_00
MGRGCRDNIVALAALFGDTLGRADGAVIVFIGFVAAFDSVSHKILDEALAVGESPVARSSDKSWAVFRAVYAKVAAAVRVRDSSGDEVIPPSFPYAAPTDTCHMCACVAVYASFWRRRTVWGSSVGRDTSKFSTIQSRSWKIFAIRERIFLGTDFSTRVLIRRCTSFYPNLVGIGYCSTDA